MRHDLEQFIKEYLHVARITDRNAEPLFRAADHKNSGSLTERPFNANLIYRMAKRRLRLAGLPTERFSCHSFRATTATDLLNQGVLLEDVQYLLGHADPGTTRLYDRRKHEITRNIVERISI